MKLYKYKWLLFILAGVLVGCSNDDDNGTTGEVEVEITSGTADFTTYVAIGNSLTAGFTDGALFRAGQENSIPNILAQQFALAGGGEFSQPLTADNIGGLLFMGNVIEQPRLFFNGTGPARLPETPTTETTNILNGPFNNMGTPGAKSFHLLSETYGSPAALQLGQANPYFVRFASNAQTTILADALAQDPTFFSLWIGNNDVLSYATSGGAGVNQAGNRAISTYGSNDITDPGVFKDVYEILVNALIDNGADGVVANIPNVLNIPYFTTVPFAPLSPANPSFGPQIPTLNATFAGLNQVFAALGVPERSITFSTTAASAVVIKDETLTDLSQQIAAVLVQTGMAERIAELYGTLYGQARQANQDDLLVLPSSSIIGQVNTEAVAWIMSFGLSQEAAGQLSVNGVTFPLEDRWVLLPSEQDDVTTATAAFNQTIQSVAQQKGLAFVDVNAILNTVATTGVNFDEFSLNASLVVGGAFSLDGVHPTARGYAYLANRFMQAINTTYGSNLPPVRAANYNTIYRVPLN